MMNNSLGCWSSNKLSITVYHMHTNDCLNVNLSTLCLVLDQTLKCFPKRSEKKKKYCSYGCFFRSLQLRVISISTLFQMFLLKWCRRNKQIQMRQLLLYSTRCFYSWNLRSPEKNWEDFVISLLSKIGVFKLLNPFWCQEPPIMTPLERDPLSKLKRQLYIFMCKEPLLRKLFSVWEKLFNIILILM